MADDQPQQPPAVPQAGQQGIQQPGGGIQQPVLQATTTPPVFLPPTPRMGGLVQVSAHDYCAWTGGKPKPDWSGLDPTAATAPLDDYQYRPASPGSSQKSTSFREKGLTTKFKRDDHLLDFVATVMNYLRRTGMDTITYLPDPTDSTKAISVVENYSRFALQDAISSARNLRSLNFDKFDRNNDDSACNWLLDSIDEALKKDISDRLDSEDGFVAHWIQMVHLIQSTSFNRFAVIKKEIEYNLSLRKYPGQNVKSLATDFLLKAKELDNHGFYEHRLTLCMLDRFLEGGGSQGDVPTLQYRHSLLQLRQKLDKALIHVGRLAPNDQDRYMASEALTYRDICSLAEDEWKKLVDDNKWAPARTKIDSGRPSNQFGVNLQCMDVNQPLTEASALVLMQQLQQQLGGVKNGGHNGAVKKGNCHKCGKPGHWANECPDKANNNGGSNNRNFQNKRNNFNNKKKFQNRPGGISSWKKKGPDKLEGCKKVGEEDSVVKWMIERNSRKFYWCDKCGRWSTSHWTKEHGNNANNPDIQASYLTAATEGLTSDDWPCAFHMHHANSVFDTEFWTLLFPYVLVIFGLISWIISSPFAPAAWFFLGWLVQYLSMVAWTNQHHPPDSYLHTNPYQHFKRLWRRHFTRKKQRHKSHHRSGSQGG